LIINCFVGPDDAETFEMEVSGFLREYGMLIYNLFAVLNYILVEDTHTHTQTHLMALFPGLPR